MFHNGNSKLGAGVWHFGIPAGRTCPGETETCAAVCYAKNGRYRTHQVRDTERRRYELAKRPDFDLLAVAEILEKGIGRLRIHSSGDVFSPAYARAWIRIVRKCPNTRFWLYTRSWRVPAVRKELVKLAKLRNVRVWFSADASSGVPKRVPKRVRVAWLSTTVADRPDGPVDLVFRTGRLRRAVAAREAHGAPVCMAETGTPDAGDVTCATCGFCSNPLKEDRTGAPARVALTVVG